MSIFERLKRIWKANVHSGIDKLEEPIKMTEQGIRELKEDLDSALRGLAEVKAMAIRARNDAENHANTASDYERKAMLLLQKASQGQIDAGEADRLATEALMQKDAADKNAGQRKADQENFEAQVAKMEGNIKVLRSHIAKAENELKTMKARLKVSQATKNLNKQLAQIDASDTIAMLERMREKVDEEEALAEAYGDIANESRSVDEEIDKALGDVDRADAASKLAALKAKMGLDGGGDADAAKDA